MTLYWETTHHVNRIYCSQPLLSEVIDQTYQSDTSMHWDSHTSLDIHHKTHILMWSIWFHDYPLEWWFCLCISLCNITVESHILHCSSLCPHNHPEIDNWYQDNLHLFWIVQSDHVTNHGCLHRLWQGHWLLIHSSLGPVFLSLSHIVVWPLFH